LIIVILHRTGLPAANPMRGRWDTDFVRSDIRTRRSDARFASYVTLRTAHGAVTMERNR
jgi:hypothetical protein